VLLVGTRSADYIRASGQKRPHSKAAYMAAPDPIVEMSEFPLAPRAPSIHGTERPDTQRSNPTQSGCKPASLGIPSSRKIFLVAFRDAIGCKTDMMERTQLLICKRRSLA